MLLIVRPQIVQILKLFSVFAFGVFLSSAFNYLLVNTVIQEDESVSISESTQEVQETEDVQEAEPQNITPIQREVTATAVRGDTLLSFLQRGGIKASEAFEISGALKKVLPASALQTGQRIDVLLERSTENPEELAFKELKIIYPEKLVQVARQDDGALSVDDIVKPLTKKMLRAGGVIRGSLVGAAEEVGVPYSVMQSLINSYSYDVDFQREIQEGDKFEVVYESMHDEDGKHIRTGDILYAKLVLSGKELPIYYYKDSKGQGAFYNEDGKSVRRALLRTPVNGARVSSRFGMRRHPVLGYSKMHRGIDFAAPSGTPIYAAGDGRVMEAGRKGSYGNYIRIRHNGEYSTAYAHLSRYASGLRKGARVKQGQVIGYVGNTGRSTGPHLHFELIRGNAQINPSSIKSVSAGALNSREMARFKQQKLRLQQTIANLPMQTAQIAAVESQ